MIISDIDAKAYDVLSVILLVSNKDIDSVLEKAKILREKVLSLMDIEKE